jgi:hypothetical protein
MEGCCEGSQGPPRTVELEIINDHVEKKSYNVTFPKKYLKCGEMLWGKMESVRHFKL